MAEAHYDFEQKYTWIDEAEDPDIITRLWTPPKNPDEMTKYKDQLCASGNAYVAGIDLTPIIQRMKECALFHGGQFDEAKAEQRWRVQAQQYFVNLEIRIAEGDCEEYRSEYIHSASSISFEQLTFLNNKALSATRTAVEDHRQMMGIFFQEENARGWRDGALRRDAKLAVLEAVAMLEAITLRDSQVYEYFQEKYGDCKEKFALFLRRDMMDSIHFGLEAQQMVTDCVRTYIDEIAEAQGEDMDDLISGLETCLED